MITQEEKVSRLLFGILTLAFLLLPALSKAADKPLPSTSSSNNFVPEEAHARARRAEKAFEAGNLKEAESLYRESLEFAPDNPQISVSLAAVETRMGKLGESERLLQRTLRLDLKNSAAWLLLGMNYLDEKQNEEAFAALVQAALLDDRNPRAHNYLGIAAGRKGWIEASEQELRRAIELDSNYADPNFNLAVLYLRRTPPLTELAHRHYQQALDLGAPKDPVIEAILLKAVASPASPPSTSSALP